MKEVKASLAQALIENGINVVNGAIPSSQLSKAISIANSTNKPLSWSDFYPCAGEELEKVKNEMFDISELGRWGFGWSGKAVLGDITIYYKDQDSIIQGMLELISSFRALQMVAHHAHHLVKGPSFFEDHNFFGELYNKADEYYDNVAERFIGLGFESHFNLGEILSKVASKSSADVDHYKNALALINEVDEVINDMTASGLLSEGTVQLLGDIADNLEVFKYKISRRIG